MLVELLTNRAVSVTLAADEHATESESQLRACGDRDHIATEREGLCALSVSAVDLPSLTGFIYQSSFALAISLAFLALGAQSRSLCPLGKSFHGSAES